MDPLDRVLDRLKKVRKVGKHQYTACCPAHDDRRPSLSVKEGEDGRVLMYCHAGCSVQDVVLALGLRMSELFPDRHQPGRSRR